jgi:cob(I)alamin adenosyltransferase
MRKGLFIVFTGEGKGKTTAALGTALRAVGRGLKVLMLLFIKGSWKSAELESAKKLAPLLEIRTVGLGFVSKGKGPTPEDIKAAQAGWVLASQAIHSGEYDLVILDELNNAIHYGLLKLDDVLQGIKDRPEALHVLVTGRNARPEMVAAADLVTEMVCVKHPFQRGIAAQPGIDF